MIVSPQFFCVAMYLSLVVNTTLKKYKLRLFVWWSGLGIVPNNIDVPFCPIVFFFNVSLTAVGWEFAMGLYKLLSLLLEVLINRLDILQKNILLI